MDWGLKILWESRWSSLVVYWVKDLVLLSLWCGFDPRPRNFCMPQTWLKKTPKQNSWETYRCTEFRRLCFFARKIKSRGWLPKAAVDWAIDKSVIKYKYSFRFSSLIFFHLPSSFPLSFPLITSANIYWASVTCQELCWLLTQSCLSELCFFFVLIVGAPRILSGSKKKES